MPFNGSQNTAFSRLTPDDGLLLQAEFERLYANDNDLKDRADGHDTDIENINEKLGSDPAGDYTDLVARLAALDNYLRVGKIEWFDDYFTPGENAPWLILSNPDAVLDVANWPLLVPYYRAKKVKYMPGTGSQKSAFDITHYARSSNVVTITLANTTAELAIIAALAEENLVHGSFSGWLALNLPAAIDSGAVPAGDYAITAIDAGARTISFAHTGSNVGTTAATSTVEFYPHRIPGSTTTARHYQVKGRTLVSTNDDDGEVIAGLRRRDRFQGHKHGFTSNGVTGLIDGGGNTFAGGVSGTGVASGTVDNPISDGSNGTPRTGKTTDPRLLGAVPALWAGKYIET